MKTYNFLLVKHDCGIKWHYLQIILRIFQYFFVRGYEGKKSTKKCSRSIKREHFALGFGLPALPN